MCSSRLYLCVEIFDWCQTISIDCKGDPWLLIRFGSRNQLVDLPFHRQDINDGTIRTPIYTGVPVKKRLTIRLSNKICKIRLPNELPTIILSPSPLSLFRAWAFNKISLPYLPHNYRTAPLPHPLSLTIPTIDRYRTHRLPYPCIIDYRFTHNSEHGREPHSPLPGARPQRHVRAPDVAETAASID